MKAQTSPWFRILALCVALGLGGTYVWRQQQNAAPQIKKPVERTVLSGSKSKVIAPTPLPVDQEQANRVLMSSSKSSSGIFTPEQERTLMKSSKSGIIKLNSGETKERVLMPGSKSFIVQPEERTLLPSSKSIPMPIFRERPIAPEEQPKPVKP